MLWDLGSGDFFVSHSRQADFLKEAELERVLQASQAARLQTETRRRLRIRERVGLTLIRYGEDLAGICVNPSVRLS